MTITKETYKRSLVINVENGTADDGSTKYKAKTFSSIKADSTAEGLYSAGTALGSLMDSAVKSVEVSEKSELLEA